MTIDDRLSQFYMRQELFENNIKVRDLKNRIDSLEEVVAVLLEIERESGTELPNPILDSAELALYALRDELFLMEMQHGI